MAVTGLGTLRARQTKAPGPRLLPASRDPAVKIFAPLSRAVTGLPTFPGPALRLGALKNPPNPSHGPAISYPSPRLPCTRNEKFTVKLDLPCTYPALAIKISPS